MIEDKTITIGNTKNLTVRIFSKILYKINFDKKKGNSQLLSIDLLKKKQKKICYI